MSKKSKSIISIFLAVVFVCSMISPASAVQKISNPNDFSLIDGIDTDKDVGLHNSYAWCSELFAQNDADYLWVGMNRDFGGSLFSASSNPFASQALEWADFPAKSEDQSGKIYRLKMDGGVNEWELVYENPAINGYRRMILFKGDLYVCAGITNKPDYDYSVILRFSSDFKLGDTPDTVLWETVPDYVPDVGVEHISGSVPEYYRSACVFEGKLYIGTTDSKIWATDGTSLTNLTPDNGAKSTGWQLVFDFEESEYYEESPVGSSYGGASYIWDLIGFNGSIYAFATNAGFTVYKFTPNGGSFDVTQIVGSLDGAKYPRGMGIDRNVMASPFYITSFEEDYIYVTTFASGPLFLGQLYMGRPLEAVRKLSAPCQVYRFDKDDNWEVVVGDKSGEYKAVDTAGNPLPVIGNQRAGFFLGEEGEKNISLNQYTWWMAEYDGKLYVTTWDMGVLRGDFDFLLLSAFINEMGDDGAGVARKLMGSYDQLNAALNSFKTATGAGKIAEFGKVILSAFQLVFNVLANVPAYFRSLSVIIPQIIELKDYINDESNPAGFDLYVSENGRDFSPVTVDGFGYADNYGGRVLVPSEYGLFSTTANPFGGGQVWRVDSVEEGILAKIPANVNSAETFEIQVILKKGTASNLSVNSSNGNVSAQISKNGDAKLITDVEIKNDIIPSKGPVSREYQVKTTNVLYEIYSYTVEVSGSGPSTLTFEDGSFNKKIDFILN